MRIAFAMRRRFSVIKKQKVSIKYLFKVNKNVISCEKSAKNMSGDRYKIQDQQGLYFLTPTIIHWIDVFTRKEYRDIIVDSLNHCIRTKGLSGVLRDFKKYTSKQILKSIVEIPESRREWAVKR